MMSVPPRARNSLDKKSFAEIVKVLKENIEGSSIEKADGGLQREIKGEIGKSVSTEGEGLGSSSFRPGVENLTTGVISSKPLLINKANPELARFCLF